MAITAEEYDMTEYYGIYDRALNGVQSETQFMKHGVTQSLSTGLSRRFLKISLLTHTTIRREDKGRDGSIFLVTDFLQALALLLSHHRLHSIR